MFFQSLFQMTRELVVLLMNVECRFTGVISWVLRGYGVLRGNNTGFQGIKGYQHGFKVLSGFTWVFQRDFTRLLDKCLAINAHMLVQNTIFWLNRLTWLLLIVRNSVHLLRL